MGRVSAWRFAVAIGLLASLLSACAANGPATPAAPVVPVEPVETVAEGEAAVVAVEEAAAEEPAAVAPAESPGNLEVGGQLSSYLSGLRAASCPDGASDAQGDTLEVTVRPVTLGRLGVRRERAGLLSYAGGFELESPDPRFGGLSGLDVLDDGDLLSVTDQGDLVWIDLADDGLAPRSVRLVGMQDENGQALRGKADGDAEGLAWNEGVALVSFERNHRVLAFDLGTCGADARGAAIIRDGLGGALSDSFAQAGLDVTPNAGPEPLAVTSDWYLLVGTETLAGGRGPLSVRPIEAPPAFDMSVEDGAPAFVGMDILEDSDRLRVFTLHRGFDSLTGNAIVVSETVLERYLDQGGLPARIISEIDERSHYRYRVVSSRRLAELGAAINNIDNFEGVAVRERPDGGVRIYLISDDNFSDRQRTLLMAFDLAE